MPEDEVPETLSPEKFIRELWGIVPKEWLAEFQFIQYRPTQENPHAKRSRSISYPVEQVLKDWDSLFKELTKHNRAQVENVHHSVNPRFRQPTGRGGAGTNADVTAYVALWVDVDYGMNAENVRKRFFETVEDLKKLGLGPSAIVESGRGLHAYWLLDKPYPTTTARPFCAGIQDYFKISDAVNDPRRILRLPGFLNLKDPKNPKWCRVSEATWMRYPLEAFKDYSVEPTKTEEEKEDERYRQETFTVSRDPEVEKIKEGPVEEGTRHESALKLVGHYAAKLKTKKQVSYVAKDWNEKKCQPPLPDDELGRIVDDLWTKEQVKRQEAPRRRDRREESPRPVLPWFDEDGNFNPAMMAAFLVREHKFLSTPIGKDGRGIDLYIHQGGVYRMEGFAFSRREVTNLLGRQARMTRINEVVDLITEFTKKPYTEVNPEAEKLVNVKNGMLNWRTGELKSHDPKDYSLFQIPAEWNPDATSKELDTFLRMVLPKDALSMVEEFAGYLLLPNTSFAKCLVLVGEGGNGKSTFLNLLESLVGTDNISYYSLHSIVEDRFTAAGLLGKLANFHDELEHRALENTGVFKQIVAGDPIKAEEKNKAPFSFRPFCRMIFATNQMPRATDRSQAYFDRFLFVEFNNRIRGTKEEIPGYGKILVETPGVLEAFLVRAVAGLKRLLDRGRFTPPASSIDAIEEYRRDCNSAYDFLRECCRLDDPNGWIPKLVLYERYRAWSGDEGRKPMSAREFKRTVNQLPNVRDIRHGNGRGWGGISWTNGVPPTYSEDEVKGFGQGEKGSEGGQMDLNF